MLLLDGLSDPIHGFYDLKYGSNDPTHGLGDLTHG